MIFRFLSLPCFFSILFTALSFAQETENTSVTTSDPTVKKEILSLSLDPLTKEEIAIEVLAWRDLLEEKAKEIAQAEIQIIKGEGDSKVIRNTLIKLREEKSAIIIRTKIALAAYELKGGEIEEYKKYIAAVSGIDSEANDLATRWYTVNSWLRSEDGGLLWLSTPLSSSVL
jgi:small conductance mechanosensitive channel